MKKILFTMMVAVAALVACAPKAGTAQQEASAQDSIVVAPCDLAYVQVEMVLAQSDLFQSEGKALEERTRTTQERWARRQQNIQNKLNELQDKYNRGLITSRDAQAQQEDLQRQAVSLEQTMQSEGRSLEEENFVFTNRAQDLLRRAVSEVNSDGRYRMIVNASALIDADTTLDISTHVLEVVNRLYAAEKENK